MERGKERIKTIGLLLENVYTDFSKEILHSVAHAIMDRRDIELIVITGRHTEDTDPKDALYYYKTGYNAIYAVNAKCGIDGLMIAFPNFSGRRYELFKDVPKVFIASEQEGELTVNYDNEKGIREAIEYLIKIRGMSKLCMIGGRDDNADARKRRYIFEKCMIENGLMFTERQYEKSNMSDRSHEAAARLLGKNPDVEAIFCVNDETAVGLYDVMRDQGLTPGRDIAVFGFDNTASAGSMVPPLASIGSDGMTLGKKALEMLLAKMEGEEVQSQVIPTRLFGRQSFEYETHEYTTAEMLNVDSAFIYRMFDDCFYRYRNEVLDRSSINLRRLFYEIISRMLMAMKNRYMSEERFQELLKMIDILFDNGVMRYTDANKFVRCIERLQGSMNEMQKSMYANVGNNRLFAAMKDRAILALSTQRSVESRRYLAGRNRMFDFMVYTTNFGERGEEAIEKMVGEFERIGIDNTALYLYNEPVKMEDGDVEKNMPDTIRLRAVLRNGELYVVPRERQDCPVGEIYLRSELPYERKGYVAFPLFYGKYFFGLIVCGVNRGIIETGEYLALQLSRCLYLNCDVSE